MSRSGGRAHSTPLGLLLLVGCSTAALAACSAPGPSPEPQPSAGPNPALRPAYATVHLDAGFRDDPWHVDLEAGGMHDAGLVAPNCAGRIADAPDVDLVYRAADYSLYIYATSDADTTLAVNAPDGSWHCSDDGLGIDPLVEFATPDPGLYNIWVGSQSGLLKPATLLISEIDPTLPGEAVARGSGSGFFVSDRGHLLTNAHVVEGCSAIDVVDHGPATVILADTADDLALLKVADRAGPVAVFQSAPPRLGADVVVLGYPLTDILAGSLNVTTGVVSGRSGIGRDTRHFQLTAPLQPGSSGGPVLDESGQVLGVVTYAVDEGLAFARSGTLPQNLNFAIRNEVVMGFLARVPLVARTAKAGAPLRRTELSERGAEITAQVICIN